RSPTMKHVALLRGINVGGKNMLPMADLAKMFAAAGCADVKTYIQSGNVVFGADATTVKGLADRIAAAIARKFDLRVPVVLRSARERAAVIAGNPFLKRGVDEKALHVAFLAASPAAAAAAGLDPQRSPGDAFELRGRDIYLWLPNGVARTRLTND